MKKPLVSVLITSYNREEYIGDAIQSVLNSSFQDFEIIVCDDCSIDNTLKIAQGFAAVDSRVRVYKNEVNLGDYPNRNKASSYARGDFLMCVDSDDKLLPNSMQKCIKLFRDFPDAKFGIYSSISMKAEMLSSQEIIQRHFFKSPLLLVGPGGSVIRTDFFKSIEGFPIKYGPANDGYYNLKAASKANTIIFPFELVFYRRHEGQEMNNKYSYLYNNYLFLTDALNELELPLSSDQRSYIDKKCKRRFFVNIIKYYFISRDWTKTSFVLKKTNFKFKDALTALFQ